MNEYIDSQIIELISKVLFLFGFTILVVPVITWLVRNVPTYSIGVILIATSVFLWLIKRKYN